MRVFLFACTRRLLAWGRRLVRYLLYATALVSCTLVLLYALVPSALHQVTQWPTSPSLLAADGSLFHLRLSTQEEYCLPIPLHSMGKWLPLLAVHIEDKRFYSHPGVDLLALGRATLSNIRYGKRISGASTITSQLVRIAIPRQRTWTTKVLEFIQAVELEQQLEKAHILELYLNRAPFGGPVRGVEAAAKVWFNKSASELSLSEAASLIAMMKGPTYYRPDKAPKRLEQRRNMLLRHMARKNVITATELAHALLDPVRQERQKIPAHHWHFAENALRHIPASHWQQGGQPLRTTLHTGMQHMLEQHIAEGVARLPQEVTAAGSIVDTRTGHVLAYVGNARFDRDLHVQFVDAGRALRSPGSLLKPFLYLDAFEQGLLSPASLLADSPDAFAGNAPRNFDRMYRGALPAGKALAASLNAAAIRVLHLVGKESFLHMLQQCGLHSLNKDATYYGDSLALGGGATTLLELSQAFSTLARLGVYKPLRFVQQDPAHALFVQKKQTGDALPTALVQAGSQPSTADSLSAANSSARLLHVPAQPLAEGTQLFSSAGAYLVTQSLVRLPYAALQQSSLVPHTPFPLAYKTGTSYGFRDAWTAAYTPQHSIIIWCGDVTSKPHSQLVGNTAAAPIAIAIAQTIDRMSAQAWYTKPQTVKEFIGCSLSALPATPFCPSTIPVQHIAGVTRQLPCHLHSSAAAHNISPSAQSLATHADLMGTRPVATITSPKHQARFMLNPMAPEQKITLQAEGMQGAIYWFINGRMVGLQQPGQALLWAMHQGDFSISCIDATGQIATSSFSIVDGTEEAPPLLPLFNH